MDRVLQVTGNVHFTPAGRARIDLAVVNNAGHDVQMEMAQRAAPPRAKLRPTVDSIMQGMIEGTSPCHPSRVPPTRHMITDFMRAIQAQLYIAPADGAWPPEAQELLLDKLLTELKNEVNLRTCSQPSQLD